MVGLGSRERVLRAIAHQDTDRLPRNLRGAAQPVLDGLVRRLGMRDEAALRDRFKADMQRVLLSYRCPYTDGRNIWGLAHEATNVTQRVATHPLAEATTVEQVESYAWPNPDWADVASFHKAAQEAHKTGRALVGSSWGSIFGEAYRLMGMDNLMIAMIAYPDVVHAIVGHVADFFLEVDRRAFSTCQGLLDLSFHGNDFGSQKGLLFSRSMFAEFFAAPTRALLDQAKSYGLRTMYHSCGAVFDVIGDLIACGVDVLDPVQVTAEGMDPRRLKAAFGGQICYHGAISAQRVLPLGTPDEVHEHVRETCEIMRPGGGYIFTSDQDITADTPIENVIAMYDAIDALGF